MNRKALIPLSMGLLTALATGIAGCSSSGYSAPKGKPDYSSYEEDNIMRVSGWVGPYHEGLYGFDNPSFITNEYYRKMSEAGMTAVYGLYETDDQEAIIANCDYAAANHMKYYARSSTVHWYQKEVQTYTPGQFAEDPVIASYKDNPGFGGHLVMDEPTVYYFDALAACKEFYNQELPGADWFVNLNPNYAPNYYLGVQYYEDYIQQYIDTVRPDYVSFDNYSLTVSSDGNDYYAKITSLQNREIVAVACRDAGIPYMNFTMITSGPAGEPRTMEKESEIRWQVMMDLAYGCTGVQYFCVFMPSPGSGSFVNSMFDEYGNETQFYTYAKNVNSFVHNIDAAFLNYQWDGVITAMRDGAEEWEEPDAFYVLGYSLEEHPGIKKYSCDQNTVIGCFHSKVDDYNGYLITGFEDPHYDKTDNVKITFSGANAALVYKDDSVNVVSLHNGKLNLALEGGEGAFVIPFRK